MHLKEIVIDGFKSYADRTALKDLDSSFTAITGRNGSGKSNVFDAICFVLGISNLNSLRVAHQQNLIYKEGQSRVTKASVTLVFANHDVKASPVGYEHCSEITVTRELHIGGRNKYYINARTAQLASVTNLFHSVQLNVNNPHFLIMQGRITKVINMKPQELLSLLEEAAGTRMYENKKKSAQKTIQKKQSKVEEIDKILKDEITPNLQRLKTEREEFLQFTANEAKIEELTRVLLAYQLFLADKKANVNDAQEKTALEAAERRVEELALQIQAKKRDINQLERDSDSANSATSSSVDQMEKDVTALSKDLVKDTAKWKNHEHALNEEKKNRQQQLDASSELQSAIESAEKKLSALLQTADSDEKNVQRCQDRVNSLRSAQLGVNTSKGAKGAGGGVASELSAKCAQRSELQSAVDSEEQRMAAINKELHTKQQNTTKARKEFDLLQRQCTEKEQRLHSLQEQLKKSGMEGSRQDCEEQLQRLKEEQNRVQDEMNSLAARAPTLQSKHAELFHRRQHGKVAGVVYGLLGELFEVSAAAAEYVEALEVCAGSRLLDVVVDNDSTAKQLLESGLFKQRVTIQPLSKLNSDASMADKVRQLHRHLHPQPHPTHTQRGVGVGSGEQKSIQLAMDLLSFPESLKPVMQLVFGRTAIVDDAETAKAVCMAGVRAVTKDGSVYESSGVITGGARPANGGLLTELNALRQKQKQLAQIQVRSTEYAKELQQLSAAADSVLQLHAAEAESQLSKQRLDSCAYAALTADMSALTHKLNECARRLQDSKQALADVTTQCQRLESAVKDGQSQQQQMDALKSELQDAIKHLAAAKDAANGSQQAAERSRLEVTELHRELSSLRSGLARVDEQIAAMTSEAATAASAAAEKKKHYETASAALKKRKEDLAASNQHIAARRKECEKLEKRKSDAELEVKKVTMALQRMHAEAKEAAQTLKSLLAAHPALAEERKTFGVKGSEYDFNAMNMPHKESELHALRGTQENLAKKMNRKVLALIESAENEFNELMSKRTIILRDKAKIEEVINELDRKKIHALDTTWRKVNSDFSSIFATLLPGAAAKLERVDDNDAQLSGLEMRVAFGGLWKESLSELSGGQRSLLALSFILSLLLFKPAPMYILDEVDAALDLSHTQNIGAMLKTHFPQSQFLVISLKEGMFNHANVVFTVHAVDGISQVKRTANTNKGNHTKRQAALPVHTNNA